MFVLVISTINLQNLNLISEHAPTLCMEEVLIDVDMFTELGFKSKPWQANIILNG